MGVSRMIRVNLDKAKVIAHDIRRTARAEEFKPFDEIISKQIPGLSLEQAEAERKAIRQKYDALQENINATDSVDSLLEIVKELKANQDAGGASA